MVSMVRGVRKESCNLWWDLSCVSLYAGEGGGNLGTGKGGSGRPTGAGKGVVPSWWVASRGDVDKHLIFVRN